MGVGVVTGAGTSQVFSGLPISANLPMPPYPVEEVLNVVVFVEGIDCERDVADKPVRQVVVEELSVPLCPFLVWIFTHDASDPLFVGLSHEFTYLSKLTFSAQTHSTSSTTFSSVAGITFCPTTTRLHSTLRSTSPRSIL